MALWAGLAIAPTALGQTPPPALPDAAAPPAAIQVPATPAYPRVTVGGQIFTDYSVPIGGPQAFHLNRAFVTTQARLSDVWSGTIILNPTGLGYTNAAGTRATEPQNVIVQMAYMQADNWLPGFTMQLGQIFVPWIDQVYAYFPYRMLSTLPVEGGLANTLGLGGVSAMPSWDRGLKIRGKLGPVGLNAGVFNGEGFRSVEGDGQRSYQAVLTYPLLAELELSVSAHRGNPTNARQSDRWAGALVYHTPSVRLGLESTRLVDLDAAGVPTQRQIHSGFGVIELPVPWAMPTRLIGRGAYFNRDSAAPGSYVETLVGIGIQPVAGLFLVLDDQLVHNVSGTTVSDGHVVALHTSMVF